MAGCNDVKRCKRIEGPRRIDLLTETKSGAWNLWEKIAESPSKPSFCWMRGLKGMLILHGKLNTMLAGREWT
jgi:hypothetical protein